MTTLRGAFVLLLRVSMPSIRRHRLRAALTLIGIIVGTQVVVATAILNRSLNLSFSRNLETIAGRANLQLSNGSAGVPEELVYRVVEVPGVLSASGLVQGAVRTPWGELTIFGIDLLGDTWIQEGRFPRRHVHIPDEAGFINSEDSLALTTVFLEKTGGSSSFEVHGPVGATTLQVRGTLDPVGPTTLFGGAVGLVDLPTAQRLFGRAGLVDQIDIALASGSDRDAVLDQLRSVAGGVARVETPEERGASLATMLTSVQTVLTLLSLIAVVVGAFLVYHTMQGAIVNRRREVALARALGFRKRSVTVATVIEAGAFGALGSLAGLMLGIGSAQLSLGLAARAVSAIYAATGPAVVAADASDVVRALGVGLASAVAATILPALRAGQLRVTELLRWRMTLSEHANASARETGAGLLAISLGFLLLVIPVPRGVNELQIAVIISGVVISAMGYSLLVPALTRPFALIAAGLRERRRGFAPRLASDQIARRAHRSRATVAALMVAFAMVIIVATFVRSLRGSILTWIDQRFSENLLVTPGPQLPLPAGPTLSGNLADDLRQIDGVREVASGRLINIRIGSEPAILRSLSSGALPRERPTILAHADGDYLERFRQGEAVLVSDNFAYLYGFDAGENLRLQTPSGWRDFEVAAVLLDYTLDLGTVIVEADTYRGLWKDDLVSGFSLWLDAGAEESTVRQEIRSRLGDRYDLSVLNVDEFKREVAKALDGALLLTYAIELVAVGVALLSVLNFFLAEIVERRHLIGLFRSIALTRGQLVRILSLEAWGLGTLGGVMAVLYGWPVAFLLVTRSTRAVSGWTLRFDLPFAISLATIGVAGVSALIAVLLPARYVAREPVGSLVATE